MLFHIHNLHHKWQTFDDIASRMRADVVTHGVRVVMGDGNKKADTMMGPPREKAAGAAAARASQPPDGQPPDSAVHRKSSIPTLPGSARKPPPEVCASVCRCMYTHMYECMNDS